MVDFLVRNFADRRKRDREGEKALFTMNNVVVKFEQKSERKKKKKTLLTTFGPDIRCRIFHCIIDIWLLLYRAAILKYQHIVTRHVQFPRYVVLFSSTLLVVTLKLEAAF